MQLEEALLRTEDKNFCIVNFGSPRAIVMGLSGEMSSLIDVEKARIQGIPIIRRFSGGGTVIVDEETLFVTLICTKKESFIPLFPEPVLRWTADLYKEAWGIPGFCLRENDYCIAERKCGGNAQYFCKDRWLHHTSFLWNYRMENMNMLLLPGKRPSYREDRSHDEFLCRLQAHGSSSEERIDQLRSVLARHFLIQEWDYASWQNKPHRQSTHYVHPVA